MKTFMTEISPGNKKTFYLHVLICYIPKIAKITYNKHKLGVGVFTMAGFEILNFKSKQIVWNQSNHKDNINTQTLKGFDFFIHE